MCNPMLVVAGLQVAQGVVQSRNELAAGKAQQNYYNYLAQQNEVQADYVKRTGEAQSRAIQETAKYEGKRFSEESAQQRASQKAALAGSGVVGVTAEDVAGSTFRNQMLDESALRYNYDVRAYEATEGAKANAYSLQNQAGGFRAAGANARYASQLSARGTLFGSLLGAASSMVNPFASSKFAIPGSSGYGMNTPYGVRNMGSYSRLPGR